MADQTSPVPTAAASAVSPSPAPAPVAPTAPPVVTAPVTVLPAPSATSVPPPVAPQPVPVAPAASAPPATAPAPVVPPVPTRVPSTAPAAPKTDPAADLAKAAGLAPAEPAPTPNLANSPTSAPVVETKVKGLPDAAPFCFGEAAAQGVDVSKPDSAILANAISEAREDFAAHKHPFGAHVAHPAYPASGFLQGYDATTGKVRVMFAEAGGNPDLSVEFAAEDLFDPQVALSIYMSNAQPPAPQPAPVSGVAGAALALLVAILLMFGNTACSQDQVAAVKSQAAKIGPVIKAIETPAVVQKEAQVLTAEVIQRGVDQKNQAKVAGWSFCIGRALMDLSGSADPSAADLEAAIQKEAGPQTDPEFPIIVQTAVDFWTVTKAAIPAGSSAATVETYLYAAATGVQNAAANYLPATTASVNAIWLQRRHEANLFFFRLERARARQRQ